MALQLLLELSPVGVYLQLLIRVLLHLLSSSAGNTNAIKEYIHCAKVSRLTEASDCARLNDAH